MNISSAIALHAQSTPSKIAVRFDNEILTYAALEAHVAALTNGLAGRLAVRPGDRVAFLGHNSIELLIILLAVLRAGAVFAPLNNRMTVAQLGYFLRHLRPSWLITDSIFQGHAYESGAAVPRLKIVSFSAGDRVRELAIEGRRLIDTRTRETDTALIVYTSGTTGEPKGVMHTHQSLAFGTENSIHAYRMTSADEILTFIPLSHIGGIAIQTIPALQAGATVNLQVDFDPGAVLREIERHRISLLVARPAASKAIISHPAWAETDISSLRAVNSGSTIVPQSSMLPWFERGIPVQQNFGMSEALPPALITSLEDARRKIGSIGRPALHCEARIVDEAFKDQKAFTPGQLVLRGKSLFSGYWDNAAATKAAFHDGWFLTGDLGHIDEEGYFFIDGRMKDIVIVDSSNVYPDDVERILDECDAIEEAAVVGRPDIKTGEALVACVVLKPGAQLSRREIGRLFANRLAEYQKPSEILFLDKLPHNRTGKVERDLLRQMVKTQSVSS